MATWLTSDLHLFHKNIIQYCNRPFSDEYEMNSSIIKVWNETVDPGDRVIVVGDLTAGLYDRADALLDVISTLRGKKTLVLGNHDHMTAKWYRNAGFDVVVKSLVEDGILYVHKPATECNPKSIRLQEMHKPKFIVHGHIHREDINIPGHVNVAWDRHHRMISLDEIISIHETITSSS
jgi:calcineurin-like phosphoesterase family protein